MYILIYACMHVSVYVRGNVCMSGMVMWLTGVSDLLILLLLLWQTGNVV